MNTKEATEFLKSWLESTDSAWTCRVYTELLELVQRGEEYKRILQHIGVISDNEQVNRIIRDTLLGG